MTVPVVFPTSVDEVAAELSQAARDRRTVAPRGAGTKLSWVERGGRVDTWISTTRMAARVAHDPGDMVATLPAGLSLAEANRQLAEAGQWLPLDPPFADRATIGGVLAANDSGPRRHRHGAPRDLILGVEAVLAEGPIVHAGGRVVKNVAGYDLSRLLCGSHGELAIITSATFKVAPLAAASRTLAAEFADIARAAEAGLTLAASPLTPSAIEMEAPAPRLLVRFETSARAADGMAADAARVLTAAGARVRTLDAEAEREAWAAHEDRIWEAGETVARVSVLPTHVAGLLEDLAAAPAGLQWTAGGRAALGVLDISLSGAAGAQAATLQALASKAAAASGRLTIRRAPDDVRRAAVAPEEDPHVRALMRAVKGTFDPKGVLAASPALMPEAAR